MSILAELRAGVVTGSADETRLVGEQLAAALAEDCVLALHGDLGVGKTTLVQGLAHGFGIRDPVVSPTFNIFHLYRGARLLAHLDAYRLDNAHQVSELMLEDFLVSPWCLAVEWPDRVAAWLPSNTVHLSLNVEAPGRHRVALV